MINVVQSDGNVADNIVHAALRHNMKPDDVTVIVAKVSLQAKK